MVVPCSCTECVIWATRLPPTLRRWFHRSSRLFKRSAVPAMLLACRGAVRLPLFPFWKMAKESLALPIVEGSLLSSSVEEGRKRPIWKVLMIAYASVTLMCLMAVKSSDHVPVNWWPLKSLVIEPVEKHAFAWSEVLPRFCSFISFVAEH